MADLLNPAGLGGLKILGRLVAPRGCGVVPGQMNAAASGASYRVWRREGSTMGTSKG